MTGAPIITVEHMRTGFGPAVLFEDLSFTVARGEVFVILGGSGCGKSTLLKHLIGLYAPWKGSIDIAGMELVTADEAQRLAILRRIGVMYQQGALFGSMNLMENVRLPLEEFTRLPDAAIEAVALAKLKLVGLDPITSAELDELILELRRILGITFVVVTHELPSIFAIADRVIMLDKETKGIIAEGAPATLRDESTHPFVRKFFHRQAGDAPAPAPIPTPAPAA